MELAHGIHRIEGIRGVNAYLYLPQNGSVVVVDTGMAGNAERIAGQVEALGRKREEIELILLTHPDVDHCGSAAQLKRITGARVAIHELDAPGLSGEKDYVRARGLRGLLFWLMMRFFSFEPLRPDLTLKDGDRIGGLQVVHCPGHTAGSICLYRPGEAVFVGDALRTDRKGNPQLPPSGMCWDEREARVSARRIAELEFDVLLPGHGEPIGEGAGDRLRGWLGTIPSG